MASPSYLIVGAGVFGASTAYYLIKKYPDAAISLVDRTPYPCPLAASWDWNKIVRADYGDLFYMEKALEAIQIWRTDPLFKKFYHEDGLINIDNTGLGHRMIENYKKLKTDIAPEMLPPEEFKERYKFFRNTDFAGVSEIFVNSTSGWAEAAKALKAVIDAAVSAGVRYIEGDIKTLTFDGDGACTGVQVGDGRILAADKIILSTGAGTAKLLADSAPLKPALQVGDRMVAACVITGIINLSPEEGKKHYSGIPAAIHSMKSTRGEVMPLTPQPDGNYYVKFCRDESFKNTIYHRASAQYLSAPPDIPGQGQRDEPSEGLKKRLETVKIGFLGVGAADVKIDSYRVCWDAITPNQDFVITAHPHCRRLYIATAGSFHGWKFMPIIGAYVVRLLDGDLDAGLVTRWGWDRDNEGSAHERLIPSTELRDV